MGVCSAFVEVNWFFSPRPFYSFSHVDVDVGKGRLSLINVSIVNESSSIIIKVAL